MDCSSKPIADEWRIRAAPPGLLATVIVLSVAAFLAAVLNDLHWGVRSLLAMAVIAYAARQVRRLVVPDWCGIRVAADSVTVRHRSGRRLRGMIRGRPFVSPLFIGLAWRTPQQRFSRRLGIFRGQLAPDDFRRLAAALRGRAAR